MVGWSGYPMVLGELGFLGMLGWSGFIGIRSAGLVSATIGTGVGIGGGVVVGDGLVGVDGGTRSGRDGMVVGGDDRMGLYRRRKRRFLVVSLPEPSVLTAYW